MTRLETTRINRLLGLIAMVAGLMAIALPGESAAVGSTREAPVPFAPSAEEAGDSLTTQPVGQPIKDSTEPDSQPRPSRGGRAPFYGGSPIPLVQPKRPPVRRPRLPNQAATADSAAADSTKAESSMEGLVCFQ